MSERRDASLGECRRRFSSLHSYEIVPRRNVFSGTYEKVKPALSIVNTLFPGINEKVTSFPTNFVTLQPLLKKTGRKLKFERNYASAFETKNNSRKLRRYSKG